MKVLLLTLFFLVAITTTAFEQHYVKDNILYRFHHGPSVMVQSIKPIYFWLRTFKKIDSLYVSLPNITKEVIYYIATNQKITIAEQQGMTMENNYLSTKE